MYDRPINVNFKAGKDLFPIRLIFFFFVLSQNRILKSVWIRASQYFLKYKILIKF